jgi:hypothetical protein
LQDLTFTLPSEYLAEQFAALLQETVTLPAFATSLTLSFEDLIASLPSESLAELSAALLPEKVTAPFLCNISDFKLCKTSVERCHPNR